MNALWNAPISDRFSSQCARVFSPAAAILESEKTLGTRLSFCFLLWDFMYTLFGNTLFIIVCLCVVKDSERLHY